MNAIRFDSPVIDLTLSLIETNQTSQTLPPEQSFASSLEQVSRHDRRRESSRSATPDGSRSGDTSATTRAAGSETEAKKPEHSGSSDSQETSRVDRERRESVDEPVAEKAIDRFPFLNDTPKRPSSVDGEANGEVIVDRGGVVPQDEPSLPTIEPEADPSDPVRRDNPAGGTEREGFFRYLPAPTAGGDVDQGEPPSVRPSDPVFVTSPDPSGHTGAGDAVNLDPRTLTDADRRAPAQDIESLIETGDVVSARTPRVGVAGSPPNGVPVESGEERIESRRTRRDVKSDAVPGTSGPVGTGRPAAPSVADSATSALTAGQLTPDGDGQGGHEPQWRGDAPADTGRATTQGNVPNPTAPATGNATASVGLEDRMRPRASDPSDAPKLDPAQQRRLIDRVARAFRAAQGRDGELRIRLSPPHLGALKLQVRISQSSMIARLETESQSSRQLLLENLPVLRDRLIEQGIQIESFEVEVHDPNQDRSGESHERREADQEQQEGSRDGTRDGQPGTGEEGHASRAIPNGSSGPLGRSSRGELNVVV